MICRLFAIPGLGSDDVFNLREGASTDEAFAWCERVARSRFSDWPLFARFAPPDLLPILAAICAFARHADGIESAPASAATRHAALDAWEDQLLRAWHGEAEHPVFVALAHVAATRELPITPFVDLITALRMDVSIRAYPTLESLGAYLHCAAAPLGRLLLHVFGQNDPALDRYAADFSTALLFTHILGDVGRDAARGHVYLPQEDLAHFEVSESALVARAWTPSMRHLMRFEIARARALFLRGRPLMERLDGRLGDLAALLARRGQLLLARLEAEHEPAAASVTLPFAAASRP